jgi:iron(III) transport system ATP-binding protein
MHSSLQVQQVSVNYADKNIVSDIDFYLSAGEIGCLLGPSGCGKTTLLRAIAGFEPVVSGSISLHGEKVSCGRTHIVPEKRNIGMVFQDFALFPHLTVEKNIAFGLRKLTKLSRQQRVEKLLTLTDLESYAKVYPHQLSGGQQQRVALARAMAPEPEILLLDEPFSSLDIELRETLAEEVRRILKQEKMTAILVTHDQMEAFAMADKIAVIQQGKLHQWGSAYQLYHQPETEFVAQFIGQGALLDAQVITENRLNTAFGEVLVNFTRSYKKGQQVKLLVRPQFVRIVDCQQGVLATVIKKVFRGAEDVFTLRLKCGTELQCLMPGYNNYSPGDNVGLKLMLEDAVVI